MKQIHNFLLLVFINILVFGATSCSNEADYIPADPTNGAEVYFAQDFQSVRKLTGTAGTFTVEVFRADKSETMDAVLNVEYGDGAEKVFSIPTKVTFRKGSDNTKLSIRYSNVERGKVYNIKLAFAEATPYANSSVTMQVSYPEEVVYDWEVVTEEGHYIDNMFAMYGLANAAIVKMRVEKAKGHNIYRFKSPYDNEYMQVVFGISNFFKDFDVPYIVLDGETYAEDGWYIAPTKLGFQAHASGAPTFNPEYENFGSVAVNLSADGQSIPSDSEQYPLGTYDKRKKMFDFGVVFHQIEGHGYFAYKPGSFLLYLDPKLMTPDINRDYTWEQRTDLTSFYKTSLMPKGWEQVVEQANEDKTLYRFPNLYENGAHIAFYLDEEKGAVTIPAGQNSGLVTNFGNQVFIEPTPGKSSYNADTETLTLGLTFYVADEKGNKTAELIQSVETILWGHATEIDQFVPGKKITDYEGKWYAYGVNIMTNAQDTATVTIKSNGIDELTISGITRMQGYTDTFRAKYDKRTGFITIAPQKMSSIPSGTDTYYPTLTFLNAAMGTFTMSAKESLTAGLTKAGKFQLVNTASNNGVYDVIACVAKTSTGFLVMGDQNGARYCYFTWDRVEDAKTNVAHYMPSLSKPSLYESPFVMHEVTERQTPRITTIQDLIPTPVKQDVKHLKNVMDVDYQSYAKGLLRVKE